MAYARHRGYTYSASQPRRTCQITWDTVTQSYIVSSPYAESFVNGLKGVIPDDQRSWNPVAKLWYLTERYGPMLKTLADSVFGVGNVTFYSRQDVESRAQSQTRQLVAADPTNVHKAIVEFFGLIPYDDAKSLYRKLCLTLHPDKGGDTAEAATLNASWATIEKEYYRR